MNDVGGSFDRDSTTGCAGDGIGDNKFTAHAKRSLKAIFGVKAYFNATLCKSPGRNILSP